MFLKAAICTKTPQGHTTDSDFTGYTKCPDGYITDLYNNTCDEPCPSGFACPGSQWSMITPCLPGTSSPVGQLNCDMANPGTYMNLGSTHLVATAVDDGYFTDVGFTY